MIHGASPFAADEIAESTHMALQPLRLFWIDAPAIGRLAVMRRPHPDQFRDIKAAGVDVVVSMMEGDEARELGLGREAEFCAAAGIEFHNLPITDHGIPSAVTPIVRLSRQLGSCLADGKGVAIHCFAGLGRSPLMAIAVLIDHGMTADAACDLVSEARGADVPERDEQRAWLLAYQRRGSP